LDSAATRRAVRAAGRGSFVQRAEALLLPVPPRRVVHPVLRLRPENWRRLVAKLDALGVPPRSALVRMDGLTPVVLSAHAGTKADRALLRAALVAHIEA